MFDRIFYYIEFELLSFSLLLVYKLVKGKSYIKVFFGIFWVVVINIVLVIVLLLIGFEGYCGWLKRIFKILWLCILLWMVVRSIVFVRLILFVWCIRSCMVFLFWEVVVGVKICKLFLLYWYWFCSFLWRWLNFFFIWFVLLYRRMSWLMVFNFCVLFLRDL